MWICERKQRKGPLPLWRMVLPLMLLGLVGTWFAGDAFSATPVYRINAGGGDFVDSLGRLWTVDQGYNTGNTFSTTTAIAGTEDDGLFQSERWDPSTAPELQYSLQVPNGIYRVNLHFAEIYSGTQSVGARVFDVVIEGTLVFDNLDIYAEVGGYTALIKSVDVEVDDGALEIQFLHVIENPKINAIEVIEVTELNQAPVAAVTADPTSGAAPLTVAFTGSGSTDSDGTIASYAWDFGDGGTSTEADPSHTYASAGNYTATLTVTDNGGLTDSESVVISVLSGGGSGAVYRINAGGGDFVDSLGRLWTVDQGYNTGNTFSTTEPIAGTADDALFQTERYDPTTLPELRYSLAVANGFYQVNLYFAEIYSKAQSVGARIFDVRMEGSLVFDNVDIYAEVGGYTALVKSVEVEVRDGVLDIDLLHGVENPKVSAIEVIGLNQAPVAAVTADPTSGAAPLTVAFTGSGSTDSDGTIASYAWDFGDGGTSTEADPSHTYASAGNYTATLTVTDNGGLTDSESVVISVLSGGGSLAVYRINAGAGSYTDSQGRFWEADQGFNTGNTFSTTTAIAGTEDDGLFQSERWDPSTAPELQYSLQVPNGIYRVNLHFAEIYSGTQSVGARVFDVVIEGTLVFDNLDIYAEVGGYTALIKSVDVEVDDGALEIQFLHVIENPKINAIEVITEHEEGELLHVVIGVDPYVVDYDRSGSELVFLKGSDSHTHEFGRVLSGFEWSKSGAIFATVADVTHEFGLGMHTVTLTIFDDDDPPKSASDSATFHVVSPDAVPGALVLYYEAGTDGPAALLDAVPTNAHFGEISAGLAIGDEGGKIGNTPYIGNVMVRFQAQVDIIEGDSYEFQAVGGTDRRLFLDGSPVSGAVFLKPGRYGVEARFAVTSLAELPLQVTYARGAGAQTSIDPALITHDETLLVPVINTAPSSGSTLGGESITITGLGFFPASQVVVQWGVTALTGADLHVTPQSIQLVSPPGEGQITVTVKTPNGVSDTHLFTYKAGSVPVKFTLSQVASVSNPTQAEWGPDGRLYVGTIGGDIKIFTFDADYTVTSVQTVTKIAELTNKNIMGIAFNPFDPPDPARVYVAHSQLFANGGSCFSGSSPYSGQVSVLTGPDFATVQPIITGLPVSNHDHGINGLQFDNNGDLLIAVGGNTNAGIKACKMGDLPESPLSAAIVKADLSKTGFNGQITYVESESGQPNNDQVYGDIVDVAAGVDVSVLAAGFRNSWDLVFTARGIVYNTDNGPNSGFGATSLSATEEGPDADDADSLDLVEVGNYYGHPNRNRGRYDDRQNTYRGTSEQPIDGTFTQAIAIFPPSTNGITEYRANTFQGAMRGNLIAQKWNGETFRIVLSPDGRSVELNELMPLSLTSLDVVTGPGGVILGIDYSDNVISILRPDDGGAVGLVVYDIFPWRAPEAGGVNFVIGGSGFGSLGGTTVTIGGVQAELTAVNSTRIHGVIPANATSPGQLLDVVVTVGSQSEVLPQAFMYLSPPGTTGTGGVGDRWVKATSMPVSLGEVSAGFIGNAMYVLGHSNNATLVYNAGSGVWSEFEAAVRICVGDHHPAEVFDGKLYLLGGLGPACGGKVQIYDPATNNWSHGADMPFAAGSSASAVIKGEIYVAGGIVGTSTTAQVAKYNPQTNTWTLLAPMPQARNHAASATDGQKLYVFGGRGPGSGDSNEVANGFDTVQIYDPATNTWVSSLDSGSTLAPLPQARGGMGKAVYYNGEFYVIGGETETGAGATANSVYDRVDIYNPTTNQWRLGSPMPTARHGIFPVLYGGRIYVAGGGEKAAFSNSAVQEIYIP